MNNELIDKVIDKIIDSGVLLKKSDNVRVYHDESFFGEKQIDVFCFQIANLFDSENDFQDVAFELCEDIAALHYRKSGEKRYHSVLNDDGYPVFDKKYAQKFCDYVEENKKQIIEL